MNNVRRKFHGHLIFLKDCSSTSSTLPGRGLICQYQLRFHLLMAYRYLKLFNFQPSLCNVNYVSMEPKNVMRNIFLSRSLSETSHFVKQSDADEANTDKVYEALDILCQEGRLKEAIHFLFSTDWRQILCECEIYGRLLQGCIDMKSRREAKRVHLFMIKHGFIPGLFLGNRLVNVYIKCGLLDYARQVFDRMSTKDVVSWTTMLDGYAKMGFIDHARQIFDEMPDRNVVSWNAMIAAYAQQGCGQEALQLFCKMQKAGVKSQSFTFVATLSASAGLEILEAGKQIHAFALKVGFESNVFVGSALLDMYAKCRCVEDAQQVFDKMPERNIVSWNAMVDGHGKYGSILEARYLFDEMAERNVASWTAMISGYAQRGVAEEAFKLFCRMQQSLSQPDQFTYACVLSICASLTVMGYGKQVHARVLRIAFESYVPVGNGLVTMYAKCGSIKDARNVFDKLPIKNVVSWTAIISGYAMHGYGYDAVELFQQMEEVGIKPNCITLLNVLSACSHSGLVDIGLSYFTSMTEMHGIIPNIDHYSCMVGLLGRAGCLDLVKCFLNNMPCEPDIRLWSALLGISRINDHPELGKHAAESLFLLEPNNSATYIVLSNIYAAAGRWDDVAKVREIDERKKN